MEYFKIRIVVVYCALTTKNVLAHNVGPLPRDIYNRGNDRFIVQTIEEEKRTDAPVWGYGDNERGPNNWRSAFPDACAGSTQSPIDIQTMNTVLERSLGKLYITQDRPHVRWTMSNTGGTIKMDAVGEYSIRGGGLMNTYKIAQCHFHWGSDNQRGSEHTINGRAYPLELHIVSWNAEKYGSLGDAIQHPDGLAVLNIQYELCPYDNRELEPIVQALAYVKDPEANQAVSFDTVGIRRLLPKHPESYFRYQGSLTTPPCSESVIWTVFTNVNKISQRQMNAFRDLLTPMSLDQGGRQSLFDNYRPVQPLNGRVVYRSC